MSLTSPVVADSKPAVPHREVRGLWLWVPLLLVSAVCVRLVVRASGPIYDPDSWWHLRVGHQYWSGAWTLRDTGPLSSFATESWVPRDWLPQLGASKFEDWFGLPGVAWLYGAALMIFVVTAYLTCRRFADPLPAALATVLTVLAAAGSLSQRPQMVSFILMLVVVGAWMETFRDSRPRWWLVPLTWIWACSHGMWYCGVVIGIAAVVGMVLDGRVTRPQAMKLAAIPVLSLVAAALTPVGPRLLLTVFDTTGMWQFVTEWAPPSFRELSPATALVMILIVIVTWGRRTGHTPWTDIGVVLVAIGWTLLSARTVALGAVVLAPVVAETLHSWTGRRRSARVHRLEGAYLGLLASICLIGLALAVPGSATAPGKVPNGLDAELTALPAGTPVLNEYELGGWLHWRHPDLQTVVDGFTDGYKPSAIAAYGEAHSVAAGWEDYVAGTGAKSALLQEDSPLATALIDRLGWRMVGTDDGFVLLAASSDGAN